MKNLFVSKFLLFAAVVLLVVPSSRDARSQEIRLRRGDRFTISVPQRPELERRLDVDAAGNVTIPIAGSVQVEGLTLSEAEESILQALRQVYPSVNSVSIDLIGDEARRVIYVHGEVLNPGKYEFRESPDLWEAVREAGGATANAALETVRIIRAEGEGRRTFLFNLQEVIETGNFESLPGLRPGDTVIIPEETEIYSGSGSVRVIGAVVTPGPYKLTADKSLIDAVLAAGGPSDNADLSEVRVIRNMPDGGQMTITVDFEDYLNNGDIRHNPIILPEDTVHVPSVGSFLAVFRDPRFWLAAVTAYAAIYAVLQ